MERGGESMGLLGASLYPTSLLLVDVVFYVVSSLGLYGTFRKAGQPGWAAFVPIYNYYVTLKMVGRPGWWVALALLAVIPVVGSIAVLVIYAVVMLDVSRSFGHGGAFAVGLFFLPFIFFYVLWLGRSTYQGPAAIGGRGGPRSFGPPGGFGGQGRWGQQYGQQQYGQGPYGEPPYPAPPGGYLPPSGDYPPPAYPPPAYPPPGGYLPPPSGDYPPPTG
jgi:hypothetical protein